MYTGKIYLLTGTIYLRELNDFRNGKYSRNHFYLCIYHFLKYECIYLGKNITKNRRLRNAYRLNIYNLDRLQMRFAITYYYQNEIGDDN